MGWVFINISHSYSFQKLHLSQRYNQNSQDVSEVVKRWCRRKRLRRQSLLSDRHGHVGSACAMMYASEGGVLCKKSNIQEYFNPFMPAVLW